MHYPQTKYIRNIVSNASLFAGKIGLEEYYFTSLEEELEALNIQCCEQLGFGLRTALFKIMNSFTQSRGKITLESNLQLYEEFEKTGIILTLELGQHRDQPTFVIYAGSKTLEKCAIHVTIFEETGEESGHILIGSPSSSDQFLLSVNGSETKILKI